MSKELGEYQKAIVSAIDLSESDLNFATMFMAKADEEFMGIDKVTHELLELENRMSQDCLCERHEDLQPGHRDHGGGPAGRRCAVAYRERPCRAQRDQGLGRGAA